MNKKVISRTSDVQTVRDNLYQKLRTYNDPSSGFPSATGTNNRMYFNQDQDPPPLYDVVNLVVSASSLKRIRNWTISSIFFLKGYIENSATRTYCCRAFTLVNGHAKICFSTLYWHCLCLLRFLNHLKKSYSSRDIAALKFSGLQQYNDVFLFCLSRNKQNLEKPLKTSSCD